ncbi:MAG: squalene synthase HpnC [Betaproteobacteria bacterium]|nr:MAG: squalene synthase HpnC [Betaproteobacteria bacterium]
MHPGHYENFPVASILLPWRLRRPVRAIYAFARSADDIADEGDAPAEARLAALAAYRAQLDAIAAGETPNDPIFKPLAHAIRRHSLPMPAFYDLIDAFSQDCVKTRYADFGEVMSYCRCSANPVGRLMLALFDDHDPRHQAFSDGICAALQLINFLQDVAIDWKKGRIYLPQDEMQRAGVNEQQIAAGRVDFLWQHFMLAQIERARKMLQAGAPLGLALKGRIGLEMRLIILGGDRILAKMHENKGDCFTQRPMLDARDWLYMVRRAVFPRRKESASGGSCASGGCH